MTLDLLKKPVPNISTKMYQWAKELFPINRSLTGPGVRETLKYLQAIVPELRICEVPSGTKAFDWTVPPEWFITEAFIKDKKGNTLIDFKENNLHVVGYSQPVDKWVKLENLKEHLYSLPEQPNAIPYVTSYYKKRWGFCMTHNQKQSLKSGEYYVHINSELKPGVMNYGEIILPGESEEEILLSTYICHPSMANNELSGPVVTIALAKWLSALNNSHRYTYRIILVPETIGAILYLSQNLEHLKRKVVAGYQITCVGDERAFSFMPSRYGDTLSDRVARHVLKYAVEEYKAYSFLERGSDERQYCSPGVDLPIASIMRSKYGEYPEYHTSLDNFDLVTAEGLKGAYDLYRKVIEALENNCTPKINVYGEPQLGKRGLYPDISKKNSVIDSRSMLNFIAYADGTNNLIDIAELIDQPVWELYEKVRLLKKEELLAV